MHLFRYGLLVTATCMFMANAVILGRAPQHTLRTVYQFSNETWIENMVRDTFHCYSSRTKCCQAIREDGSILATNALGPELFLVNTLNQVSPPPVAAYFPKDTALLGIAELQSDVFYVASLMGDILTDNITANSSAIWKIDMHCWSGPDTQACTHKVTDLPAIEIINGVTVLSKDNGTILVADSGPGNVWKVDVNTGSHEIVLDDPLFKAPPNGQVAVNGLLVGDSTLYFSSTSRGIIGALPINCEGHATGSSRVVGHADNADDFARSRDGNFWVPQNANNTLSRITPGGITQLIAGALNETTLNGPTVAKFGRRSDDQQILYVGTDGNSLDPSTQQLLRTPAKIVAIDTSSS